MISRVDSRWRLGIASLMLAERAGASTVFGSVGYAVSEFGSCHLGTSIVQAGASFGEIEEVMGAILTIFFFRPPF